MESAIKQGDEKYRRLFESSRDAIMTLEPPSWVFTSGNPATLAMFGVKSAEEFISLSPGDLSPERQPDGRLSSEKAGEMIETAMREGSHSFEWTHRRKDGKDFPAAVLLTRVEISGKRFLQATVRDITERKLAEKEEAKTLLRQQMINQLLQSLLAPAPLEKKLATITDGIITIFEADFCRIWLMRPGDLCEQGCAHAGVREGPHVCHYRDRCLHLSASSGRYTHMDGAMHRRVPFGCYKIGLIASGEEHRFLTNDVQHDPEVHNHDWARELGLVSFAGYQLRVPGGETMGVLALFAKHPILPIEDVLLDSISSIAGSVIQQAIAEEALRVSEERLSLAISSSGQGLWDWNIATDEAYLNPGYYELIGYEAGEIHPNFEFFRSIIHPEDYSTVARIMTEHMQGQSDLSIIEYRIRKKSGEYMWILGIGKVIVRDEKGSPVRMIGIISDITERKRAEEHIQTLLSEKELLLKEVHHRINNNMTMIANLLSLQASRLADPEGVKALKESHTRVMSMAKMYNLLYKTIDFRYVHTREYIGLLIDGLTASLPVIAGVTVEKRIDDFEMDSEILFPIGIIINELVTNAYKYAFPDGRAGTIAVSVSRLPEKRVEIVVRDDGAGIPESLGSNGQSGFGMKLVNLLVKQIEGTLECVRGEGATFRVTFHYDDSPPVPRAGDGNERSISSPPPGDPGFRHG